MTYLLLRRLQSVARGVGDDNNELHAVGVRGAAAGGGDGHLRRAHGRRALQGVAPRRVRGQPAAGGLRGLRRAHLRHLPPRHPHAARRQARAAQHLGRARPALPALHARHLPDRGRAPLPRAGPAHPLPVAQLPALDVRLRLAHVQVGHPHARARALARRRRRARRPRARARAHAPAHAPAHARPRERRARLLLQRSHCKLTY